ncbi:MAG: SIMPL domain-containing protein [Deltaproteobacteria bacterium]|nr:SIMPL domain-containing protein [Deltaproteobacteria bacterium]
MKKWRVLYLFTMIIAIDLSVIANAATASENIIVSGEGRVKVEPDMVIVRLGVEMVSSTLGEALDKVNGSMKAVLDKIKSFGVKKEDIQTTFNVTPRYSKQQLEEPLSIIGYHVSNHAQIKIRKVEDAGKIIDGAFNAGANTISGLMWNIEDKARYLSEARSLAVKNAMRKANELAIAADVKVGKILRFHESSASISRQEIYSAYKSFSAGVRADVPVESGELEAIVNVSLEFRIIQ